MKQLLLRVPDSVHAQLARRAERENRSVNSIATEVLAVAASVDPGSRKDRLRLRASSLGLLAAAPASAASDSVTTDQRADAIEQMRGAGQIIDAIIEDGRGPR